MLSVHFILAILCEYEMNRLDMALICTLKESIYIQTQRSNALSYGRIWFINCAINASVHS